MNNSETSLPHSASADRRTSIHAVLVPGFWLGGWAWQDVEPTLQAADITTHPVTLPGLDGTSTNGVTLADHIDAVATLVQGVANDEGQPKVVLVGHSGGGVVVQGVIDRHPDLVARIIYVDSGPMIDGVALMPDADADVALPRWEELASQGSSTEGMDDEALASFRMHAVPQPVGVARSTVHVTNPERHKVPASLICTSFGSQMLTDLIDSGRLPSELRSVTDVTFVDLPTGHWPMYSRPDDLAAALREEILRPVRSP